MGKIHYTQKYARERIREPSEFQKGSFRTIDPGKPGGPKVIVGRPKGKKVTRLQAILRPRQRKLTIKRKFIRRKK